MWLVYDFQLFIGITEASDIAYMVDLNVQASSLTLRDKFLPFQLHNTGAAKERIYNDWEVVWKDSILQVEAHGVRQRLLCDPEVISRQVAHMG